MPTQDKGIIAHSWAEQIYSLSEKCLMAHSIRAVEKYIEEELQDPLRRKPQRIRVIPSKSNTYLGKRALAMLHPGRTEILVDEGISFEDQRKGIAHELAHILFVAAEDGGKKVVRDRETEDACTIFERDLCKRHDVFYSKSENIARLRFPSLQ